MTAEPGRAIVAQAGMTLYRVGTIKDLPGIRTYVSVDGGMSDNPRPVLYGSGYETFLPRAADADRTRAIRLVGKHCESGDLLVRTGRVPDDLAVGDVLCTPVTGAYGHSMGSNYNKVTRPAGRVRGRRRRPPGGPSRDLRRPHPPRRSLIRRPRNGDRRVPGGGAARPYDSARVTTRGGRRSGTIRWTSSRTAAASDETTRPSISASTIARAWTSTSSRSSTSPTVPWSGPRRCCGGVTLATGCCPRRTSSTSP